MGYPGNVFHFSVITTWTLIWQLQCCILSLGRIFSFHFFLGRKVKPSNSSSCTILFIFFFFVHFHGAACLSALQKQKLWIDTADDWRPSMSSRWLKFKLYKIKLNIPTKIFFNIQQVYPFSQEFCYKYCPNITAKGNSNVNTFPNWICKIWGLTWTGCIYAWKPNQTRNADFLWQGHYFSNNICQRVINSAIDLSRICLFKHQNMIHVVNLVTDDIINNDLDNVDNHHHDHRTIERRLPLLGIPVEI